MLGKRILILLGVCFLAASAAWADDIGFVDCGSHSEGTQVFAKPRRTPDVVAPLPCGESFTILVYGFYFSRIQTKDGQVGYIYSNLISVGPSTGSVKQAPAQTTQPRPTVQQVPTLQMAAEKTKIPPTPPIDAQPASAASAQPAAPEVQPGAAQPAVTTAPAEPSPASAAPTPTPNGADTTSSPAATGATAAQPDSSVASQPQPPSAPPTTAPEVSSPASSSPSADPSSAPAKAPEASTSVAEAASAAAPQPEAATPSPAAAQPDPEPAQPAAPAIKPAIKPADARESWEKPRATGRTAPLMELYGGYAFARMGGASSGSNLNGALGSFGWNPKSWLQVVADTSYSVQSGGGVKNVLYGNHFGPRLFRRTRNRWGITPFVEGLVGGSSERTTISGAGGSSTTTGSSLSYKVGGGLDIHPSRRWDVRLFDVDYYRTTFGSGLQQNNYWISTGVVLRLFGGRAE